MDKYIGKLLDNRYEILEIIGIGGMAVVYKAHCKLLNRYVAIKILKDEYAKDADFRRRFHAESQAVAKLSHQNIVSIYDVNRSDNIEYIVMELIDGVTLKEYMSQNGKLTTNEFLHFAPQIAAALDHAHTRGIIHRDIKPQNIIILPDGSIKVMDFGIARFAKGQQTLTDEALGSVHYVSPEQARGTSIDERSDIYSFGVVMYEMLTGCLPFEGDSPVAVVLQHINSIPLQPREIDSSIPQALEDITMKAMNPMLSKRYESCKAILADFENYRLNPAIEFGYSHIIDTAVSDPVSDDTKKFNKNEIREKSGERSRNSSGHSHRSDRDNSYFKRPSPFVTYLIIGVLVSALFLGGAAYLFLGVIGGAFDNNSDDIQVPTLIGKELSAVLSDPQYAENYNIIENESMYNDTFEEGYIIDQEPSAGRRIKPDSNIYVTVSLGEKTITLPDISNYEYRYAQLQLTKLDLTYKVEHELSDDIAQGNVTRTEPEALSDVKKGDVITIYVSLGKEVILTTVPNLIGENEGEAQRLLEKNSLVLGEIIPTPDSSAQDGTIVDQSIEAGSEVNEKTPIDIYVCDNSIGNDVPDEPTPEKPPQTNTTGTHNLTIKLPESPERVKVTLKAAGEVIYEKEHNTSEGSITIPLKGSGSILARLYFDDKLSGEQVIRFS